VVSFPYVVTGCATLVVYLEGGEVDNAVDFGMFRKDVVQRLLVRNVGLIENGTLSADQLNAIERDL
jgi:hypothetical protein